MRARALLLCARSRFILSLKQLPRVRPCHARSRVVVVPCRCPSAGSIPCRSCCSMCPASAASAPHRTALRGSPRTGTSPSSRFACLCMCASLFLSPSLSPSSHLCLALTLCLWNTARLDGPFLQARTYLVNRCFDVLLAGAGPFSQRVVLTARGRNHLSPAAHS